MKKTELLDILISYKGGGVATDEAFPNKQYFDSRLKSIREWAIREEYRRDKTINSANYQKFFLEYDSQINDGVCDWYIYNVPQVLRVNDVIGSFAFVGATNEIDQWNFYESMPKFANWAKHRLFRPSEKNPTAYYDWESGVMKVTQPIKSGLVSAIFYNPDAIPTFNVDMDEYPISAKAWEIANEALKNGDINFFMQAPQDKISNSQTDVDLKK